MKSRFDLVKEADTRGFQLPTGKDAEKAKMVTKGADASGVVGLGGTLMGVLLYGTLQVALVFDGRLDVSWTRIAMGGLLLGSILLQRSLASVSHSAMKGQ